MRTSRRPRPPGRFRLLRWLAGLSATTVLASGMTAPAYAGTSPQPAPQSQLATGVSGAATAVSDGSLSEQLAAGLPFVGASTAVTAGSGVSLASLLSGESGTSGPYVILPENAKAISSVITRICTPATLEPDPTPNQEYCLTVTSPHPGGNSPVVVQRNYNDVGRAGQWRVVEYDTVDAKHPNVLNVPQSWLDAHNGDPLVVIYWVKDPRVCLAYSGKQVRLGDCRKYVWVWRNGQAMSALERPAPPQKNGPVIPPVLTAPDLNLSPTSIRPFNDKNQGFLQTWHRR